MFTPKEFIAEGLSKPYQVMTLAGILNGLKTLAVTSPQSLEAIVFEFISYMLRDTDNDDPMASAKKFTEAKLEALKAPMMGVSFRLTPEKEQEN